ncbi:MAG: hypothetical protein LBR43_01655 [Spiroplasmataceae bacterium]|jgi:hypothetical protein|nr:hypothetical protein [Spiroplasmataceae bacterium]
MILTDKFWLCYVNIEFLEKWVKENNLLSLNFSTESEKWIKEINNQFIFFVDTELLLIKDDIIVLKSLDDIHANFLVKTYQLEYQKICQKIFKSKKNLVIINDEQWKKINDLSPNNQLQTKKALVLLKDEETIEKNLANWVEKIQ